MSNSKLALKAIEYGEPLSSLIPRLIFKHGSVKGAADELGVYENSLRFWLKKNKLATTTVVVPSPHDGESAV